MMNVKRMLLAAVTALCALAIVSTAASATTPLPYSTSTGTGTLSARTILGTSSCSLSGVTGALTPPNRGTVTGFRASGCGGFLASATYSLPILIVIDLSTANPRITVTILGVYIVNTLGGRCLYQGTLTGTGTDGTGNASVSGQLIPNAARSSGFCSNPAEAILRMSFPGLRF